jgi:hypothetical protein
VIESITYTTLEMKKGGRESERKREREKETEETEFLKILLSYYFCTGGIL